MNTTLIFAELLIIGLEGGIWFFFLIFSLFGINDLDKFLNAIREWQLIVVTIAIPLLYVLGIILDRMADILFKARERTLDREIAGDLSVSVPVMRFTLGTKNDFLNQQLEYTRTRMRIVRASVVNFALIAISISIFLLTHLTSVAAKTRWQYVTITVILGLVMSYAAFVTWKSLVRGHLRLSKIMYEHQNPKKSRKRTLA